MRPERKKTAGITLLLACMLGLAGCSSTPSAPKVSTDTASSTASSAAPFGCDAGDTSACEASESVDPDAEFEAMEFGQAIELFENQGDGLLYFGFPDCPWCQEVLPLLKQAADSQGVTVHYIRTRDDNKELLYTEEQKTAITPYLAEYIKENKEGKPTLYVPLIVAVKDGKVVSGHQGTVDEHDAHERKMTDDEKKQVEDDLLQIAKDAANAAAS